MELLNSSQRELLTRTWEDFRFISLELILSSRKKDLIIPQY